MILSFLDNRIRVRNVMIIWLCFIFISLVPNFLKIRSTTKQSKKYRSLLFLKVTTQKRLRGAVDLENSPAPGTQAGRALPYSQCWRRARQQRAVLQVRDGWPTPGVSGTGEWELAQGYLDRHLPRVCPWKAVGPSAYQPCFFLADLVSLQWLMVNEFTNSLVQDFSGAFLELSIHTGGQVWRSRARRTFLTGEYGINLSRGHHQSRHEMTSAIFVHVWSKCQIPYQIPTMNLSWIKETVDFPPFFVHVVHHLLGSPYMAF